MGSPEIARAPGVFMKLVYAFLVLFPLLSFASPPRGIFHMHADSSVAGWDALEYCGIKEEGLDDFGSRKRRDSIAVYYLQKAADARCEGANGSAKLVEGTLKVHGICSGMEEQAPAYYSMLAVARFQCQ